MRRNKSVYLSSTKKENEPFINIYIWTDSHDIDGVAGNPTAPKAITENGTRMHFQMHQKLELFVEDVLNDKPDLVLGLGDYFDIPAPIEHFKTHWGRIPEPKALTLGNHDYTLMGMNNAEASYNNLAVELGFNDKPVNAGSKLNYSFYQTSNGIDLKVIFLDFALTKDANGNIVHQGSAMGSFVPEQMDWLESEINNSRTNQILLCSHYGMHYGYYFPTEYADTLKATLERTKTKNPKLNLYGVFGHSHRFHPVQMGNMLPVLNCYNASAICERFVDIEESKHTTYYTIFKIYKDKLVVDKKPLKYTGAQPNTWQNSLS